MSRIDYCVTTMDRPRALERLLFSLAAHRPEASIHVADQSRSPDPRAHERLAARLREAGLRRPPTVHPLPFDCGVSAARNHLVNSTPGEYKLILDDDFAFTERTDIDAMAQLMDAHPEAGVIGGSVSRGGHIRNVGTLFETSDGWLRQLAPEGPLQEHGGVSFRRTDCVPMFALMRRGLSAQVSWDPNLKTAAEHFDFFLRLRETPYLVLHTPDAVVDHPPIEAEPRYQRLRWRSELLAQMMAKHRLTHLETLDGTITELRPDGELIRYCQLKRHVPEQGPGSSSAGRSHPPEPAPWRPASPPPRQR